MITKEKYPPPTFLLPHRGNMQLIDQISEFDAKGITVRTCIKEDSPFLDGHFPNYPILPGIVLLEMMFQACGLHGSLSALEVAGILGQWDQQEASVYESMTMSMKSRAIGADKLIFKKPVFPGDELEISAIPMKSFLQFSTYEATVKNAQSGELVAKSTLTVFSGKNN
ncbi:MAG: hypothetical protein R2795_13585 [Saprospiraceae bacterium]